MIRIAIALEILRHATRMVLPVANAALLADRRGLSGISCVRPCSVERKRWPARSARGGGGSAHCSGKRVDHTYSCHFLPIPSRHFFCCLHLPHPVLCGNQLLYCNAQQKATIQHLSDLHCHVLHAGQCKVGTWLSEKVTAKSAYCHVYCPSVVNSAVINNNKKSNTCLFTCYLYTTKANYKTSTEYTDATEIHKIRHRVVIGFLMLFL